MKKRNIDMQDNQVFILDDNAPFAIKEAYSIARSNLKSTLIGTPGCKIVVVVGANPGDGKSTTCINLAITVAKAGSKVLVIDGDMRRSTMHKYLNLSNKIGLSNVLCGYTNLDEAIQNTEHGIACLTAGEPPINPAELLMSDLMRELLELLSKHYDYIFIDSPPVPLTSDALSLADMVSGYIITVRNEVTPVEQLDKCVEALRFAGAKLLGIMLNNADGGERSYRKKRGYSYKKNYYTYDYASKDEQ